MISHKAKEEYSCIIHQYIVTIREITSLMAEMPMFFFQYKAHHSLFVVATFMEFKTNTEKNTHLVVT